jgi:hypothetical protein
MREDGSFAFTPGPQHRAGDRLKFEAAIKEPARERVRDVFIEIGARARQAPAPNPAKPAKPAAKRCGKGAPWSLRFGKQSPNTFCN